ncbi:MAG: hypothetical protein WD016_08675 [Balneolaceae bacterium]
MKKEYRISFIKLKPLWFNLGALRKIRELKTAILIPAFLFVMIAPSSSYSQPLELLYKNLDNATSLDVTPNAIYIVEQGRNRLLQLDHSGELLESMGGRGSGDYQFSRPIDVDATNGLKVYVSDYNNRRVKVLGRRGEFLSQITALKHFGRQRNISPTQISVDELGQVIFYDESTNSIQRINEEADLIDEFRLDNEILRVDDMILVGQLLFILDSEAELIHVLSENGNYELFYPAKDVFAFHTDGETIWKSFASRLVIENRNSEDRIIEFGERIPVVDIDVMDGTMYVLGDQALYKIQ